MSEVIELKRGYLPPQAIDIEQVVLGAAMVSASCLDDLASIILTPEIFYKEQHRVIYQAIATLYSAGNPIDLLTVSEQLKKMEQLEIAGGYVYLVNLTQQVSSTGHQEYHCRILLQYYIKREVIRLNSEVIEMAYSENTDSIDLLSKFQNGIDAVGNVVANGRQSISFPNALQHLRQEVEMLTNNTENNIQLVGVATGFNVTDAHTGGYRAGDLVILAARPGMGKTAKVLKTAIANVSNGNAVGFISLEMSTHQLTARAVALDTNFHLSQLLKKGFEKQEYFQTLQAHINRMSKYGLHIDDTGQSDINEVKITAKLWKRKHGIKLLVVDYLQLMTDRTVKGNREQEISSISRKLKLLAKELGIPVIALSQLSRAVETRGGSKRPLLSDLRESGAIEQDADIIEFIYRPEYYKIEMIADDYDSDKHRTAINDGGNTEIIYAKYRGGSTGTAILQWIGDKTKFIDPMDSTDTAEYIDEDNTLLPTATPTEAFDPIGDYSNTNANNNDEPPF